MAAAKKVTVGVIVNGSKPGAKDVIYQVVEFAQSHPNLRLLFEKRTARLIKRAGLSETALAKRADVLLVAGGDGSLLDVVYSVYPSQTPILGVNIGSLGFLTAIPSSQLAEALKQVWAGEFIYETRALIEASGVFHGKKLVAAALNDIVVTRGAISRLIALDVSVNGELVTRYRCDGLIISSPTGSTAYSLAAGGAIVLPTADVFALTPICPHALSNRSIILPLSASISVKAINTFPAAFLNADGQIVGEMDAGDEIVVRRSRHSVRLLRLANGSFLEAMRRKLHWRGTYL